MIKCNFPHKSKKKLLPKRQMLVYYVEMKKERLTKSFRVMVVILSGTLLLLGETYGANSLYPRTQNNSENRSQQTTKPAYKQVNKTVANPSSFKPDMPLEQAIDILRNSTVPPLNIVVLWKDLEENADIYRDTPIGMDGVSRVPLRTHLKLLLMSVSAGGAEKLVYVVDDGVITIATQGSLPKKMISRVYDISDLVSAPANFRLMPGLGMPAGYGRMPYGGMMPSGGMGYRGQGFYGRARPYRGVGRRTSVGRTPIGTNLNTNSYATTSYSGYRTRRNR